MKKSKIIFFSILATLLLAVVSFLIVNTDISIHTVSGQKTESYNLLAYDSDGFIIACDPDIYKVGDRVASIIVFNPFTEAGDDYLYCNFI